MKEENKILKDKIKKLEEIRSNALGFIREETSLNDSEIDELAEILDGDYNNSEINDIKFKILNETTNHCNECLNKEHCPEHECVLYRIEKLVENA